MSTAISFDTFRSRLAGRQISVADAQRHPALQDSPGLQRTLQRAASSDVADGFVRGDAELRQLFGDLSRWYGAPGSSAERMVMPADGALARAIDGLAAVSRPEPATPRPTLRAGSEGAAVESLQTWLKLRGFDPGPQDGLFGPRTEGAVRAFQNARGLAVDGVVGPQTWGALLNQRPSAGPATPAVGQGSSTRDTQGIPGAAGGEGATLHQRLVQQYSSPDGYQRVQQRVRQFYPPNKDNGCVAYMSEALRQSGVPIPIKADASGMNISLVTTPFSNHLERELGWQRVNSRFDLKPGDICFTLGSQEHPKDPAHTYMFHSWQDKARGIANVVDNQDNVHLRNITQDDYGQFNFMPFAYALRAPGA